jgi:hypothetical protein
MPMAALSLTPEAGEDSPGGASTRGSHRLAAVATCERLWALRYYWFIRLAKDNPWRLGGTLVHTTREYLFASMMPEHERPAWFYNATLEQRLWEQAGGHAQKTELVNMSMANLADYMQFAQANIPNMRPIAIEREEWATLGELDPGGPWPELDPEIVTCRNDLLYQDGPWEDVMDFKSHGRSKVNSRTGRLTKWKPDGEYGLNWQALVNLHLTRARRGPMVRAFVIGRTTRQVTQLGFYDHDHHVLEIPGMAYEETPRQLRRLVKKERDLMHRLDCGGTPEPSYHACYGRFGPCDYRYACMAKNKAQMMERLMGEEYTQAPQKEIQENRSKLRVIQ